MTEKVQPVPVGIRPLIPRLFCRDPVTEIDFCKAVFGATETVRRAGADGRVAHAALMIGGTMVMVESEWPGITTRAPAMDGSSPVVLYLYVERVDEVFERAVAAGATVLMPPKDQFWGDRTAWFMDPSGHVWTVASRVEETTEPQRQERLAHLHDKASG